jgi:hypothetical protein
MGNLDKAFDKALAASKKKTSIELGDELLKIRNRLNRLLIDRKEGKYGTGHVGDSSLERLADGIAEIATELGATFTSTSPAAISGRVKRVHKALGYTVP